MSHRRWRYPSDGSPPYEVIRKPRPALHVLHLTEARGADGKVIPRPELRRLNALGKNIHVEELRDMALDGHNEQRRQEARDKQRRKEDVAQVVSDYGL